MKTIKSLFFALALIASTASFSNAATFGDKTSDKARTAVENAAPDDWKTLAKSAKQCIRKGVNMKEAAEWLDRSLAIKETSYNLEAKGDYYAAMNLPEKAIEMYIAAITKGEGEGSSFYATEIQEKIQEQQSKR